MGWLSLRARRNQLQGDVLGALGALGAGLIYCRALDLAPVFSLIPAAAGLLGGITGTLSFGRSNLTAGLLLGLSALAGFWGGLYGLEGIVGGLFTAAAATLVFAAISFWGYGFCGHLGCWSVILLASALFLTRSFGAWWQTLASLCTVLSLLLTLDGFRDNALRKSQHLGSGAPMTDPGHIRRGSLRLFLLFLLGSLLAALLGYLLVTLLSGSAAQLWAQVRETAMAFYNWLGVWIERFRAWFLGLFQPGVDRDTTHVKEIRGGKPLPGIVAAAGTALMVICFIIGMGLFVGAILAVRHIVRVRPKVTRQTVDFVDEIEDLERPKGRLRSLLRRRVFGKMSDYQGAMKIRFAFQQLLRRRRETDPMAYTKTPNELRQPGQADQDALIDAYNRVRYGQGGVSEEDIAAAERVLKTK